MTEVAQFEPEWFSPPGEAVAEKLRSSGRPLDEFAFEMDLDEERVQRLFEGQLEITEYVAERLEKVFGVSASFWLTREAHYRRDMRRIAESVPKDEAKTWLRTLPLKDMETRGWIVTQSDPIDRLAECFRYFDVPSIPSFDRRVSDLVGAVKLRTSDTLKSDPIALATWIRKGEIEAEHAPCGVWNAETFQQSFDEIRKLTLIRDPNVFLPTLKHLCAASGVALVIAKGTTGCKASGATKFINKDKALLLLSFRHLSDDHFWFSFFHECGHLVLHGKDQVFVEGEPHDTELHEKEANEFAEKTLIPDPWFRLLDKLSPNRKDVIRFAVRVGVSPGIIVGQLQHRKRINHGYLNYLKRRFEWRANP
jgi:HTH-type transcriptional regulator / antitoxin HigA